VIWDPNTSSDGIRKLYKKYDSVFHFIGNPKVVSTLGILVESAQYVLICSPIIKNSEMLDMDAVIIANYMEEWFPNIPYCVDMKNEK